jgi:hypothetical protein
VTPEERAAKGGNSIAAATVQVSTNFSDIDRVDANQPEKYYQFTVTEPGYVSWNLTSLNPVSGFPTPPEVTVIKADGKPGSHTFFRVIGAFLESFAVGEGQTSFQGGNFYDPGTYYLKVGNGAGSTFNDYNISTQFIADRVSSFTGNIQYRTQPYYSLDNSLQSAVFSGPAVSELSNLSGVVTYDNINFNNRIAKYGVEVNESGKIRINLNSPNGKMGVSVKKFIGSDDRPESIASLEVSANSDRWLELDLNKGRYDIEVNTPSDVWLEPDWNSTQEKLVRPYTLNATFTPNAPQPGQGKVPSSAGAFDKTVVSNGVVTHYYANGYLTLQPSGQASWYSYGTGNAIGVIEISAVPLPFEIPPDYAGNSPDMARDIGTLIGTQIFHDVIDRNDRFDYYKFNITSESKVDFALSGKMGNTGFYLFQDWYFNSDHSTHIDRISGTPPGVVPEFSETLKPGTYYVLVHKPKDYDGDEYDLKLSATPLGDPDGNDSIQTAEYLAPSPADFGDGIDHKAAEGSIGGNLDREDYYGFTLDKISDVNIEFSGNNSSAKFYLAKDLNGNGKLDYGEALQAVSNGNIKNISHSLGAGTYYVVVSSDDTVNQTNYSLKVDTQPEKAGNYPSQALDIGLLNGNKTFQGLVDTKEDTYDYYRFNLNETSNVSFKLDKLIAESSIHTQGINPIVTVELISANNEILASARGDSSSAASINRLLEPGAYYIRVNSTDTTGYASYELNLSGEVVYKEPNESPSLDKTVGYDGTNTHQTYVNTFTNNGGSSALGSATGNVHPLVDNGYVQEFSGGSEGSGAIMKSGANDYSYWVGSFFWDAYVQTGGVTGILGYPISDRYEFNGGWRQDFQGGSLSTTLPLTPPPNSGTNTSPQAPQILSRLIESGTGKLITATNFRSSPWADPSNSNLMQQGISAGTTFTLLENVTTNDPTYPNWYRVRLNNGDVGYFWANNVEKLASSSGDSKPILNFNSGGISTGNWTFLSQGNKAQQIEQIKQKILALENQVKSLEVSKATYNSQISEKEKELKDKKDQAQKLSWPNSWNPLDWLKAGQLTIEAGAIEYVTLPNLRNEYNATIAKLNQLKQTLDISRQELDKLHPLPTSVAEAQRYFKSQFNPNAPRPNANCGPTSLAMAFAVLNLEPSGLTIQQSIDRAKKFTLPWSLPAAGARDFEIERGILKGGGTNIEDIGKSDILTERWAALDRCLSEGKPVVAFGKTNAEWSKSIGYPNNPVDHVIAILGKTPDGKYIVGDPEAQNCVAVTQIQLKDFFRIYGEAPAGRAFSR